MTVWRLVYVRDWLHNVADRCAFWRAPGDRLEREIKRWLAENAERPGR